MEYIDLGKSANQIWKESGSTLSFKNWLQREKDKGRFLPNKTLSEFSSVDGQATLEDVNTEKQINKPELKSIKKDNYFDVSKAVIIVAVGLVIGGIGLYYYKKR
jgi:hypothetical protein